MNTGFGMVRLLGTCLFLMLTACWRSGFEADPDLCLGIDCSGHGMCVWSVEGTVRCKCQDGYREEGLTCIPVPWPCEGVDCSGSGTCVVTVAGQARCACNEGFQNDGPVACIPDQTCSEDPECDDQDPCTQDACVQGFCNSTPLVCETPPDDECVDHILMVYDAEGHCQEGGCVYPAEQVACLAGQCRERACQVDLIAGFNLDGDANDLRYPDFPPHYNGTIVDAQPTEDGIRGATYRAFTFTSQAGRIEVPGLDALRPAFTWMAWVRPAEVSAQPFNYYPRLLSQYTYHGLQGCTLSLLPPSNPNPGRVMLQCYTTDSERHNLTSRDITIFDDTWHHVAVTWDRDLPRAAIWVDGEATGGLHQYPPGEDFQDCPELFTIGSDFDGAAWQYGHLTIDEVYLFDRVLGQDHIRLLMEEGLDSTDL